MANHPVTDRTKQAIFSADRVTSAPPSPKWTLAIRITAGLISGAVVLAGTISVLGFLMIRTKTETRHFQGLVRQVQVTGPDGDVVIRTGTAQQGASVLSRSRSSFQTAEHRETVTDGVLQVSGSCRGEEFIADQCSVDFEITVPPGTAVLARTSIGSISVTGTGGPVTAESNTGDIRVRQVTGSIRLTTNIGNITGELLNGGRVSGQSDTGDVRLSFAAAPEEIRVHTDIGDVRVRVPDDATTYREPGDVGIGDRTIDVPIDPTSNRIVDLSTNTGDVWMGTTS